MNPHYSVYYLRGALMAALVCTGSAQSESPASNPFSTTAAEADEVVVLTPFEVRSDDETGYLASETLSGTRLRAKIEDTGVAETIITPDFMRDLGLTSLDQVFRFVPNTTTDDPQLGTAAGNNELFSSIAYTSRGFSVTTAQRDFLPTFAPADIYNTERISFTRGPNAILYGLGNPGGISNAVSKRANIRRNSAQITARVDSNGGLRTTADANVRLINGTLGLRIARLDDDRGSYIEPDENRNHRTYAALRFQPWEKTILDVTYEEGYQRRRAFARGYTYSDGFSSWTTLPAGDRPRVSTAGTVLNNNSIPGLELLGGNQIYLIDGASPAIGPMNWSRMGKTPVASPNLNNAIHGVTGEESFALPFPIDTNIMGYADGYEMDFRDLAASLKQNILPDLDVELTYNRQTQHRFIEYSKSAGNDTLMVDPNAVLPNGAPNPNFGKYYYEAGGTPGVLFFSDNKIEVARATVSYEFDAEKHFSGIGRWLGRHRFAGLFERQDNPLTGLNNATFKNLTPTQANVPGLAATWNPAVQNPSNTMVYRYYLDPAAGVTSLPSLWNQYPTLATSDNIAALQAAASTSGNGVTPGFATIGLPTLIDTQLDSQIFAMHNYWLNERVITLFGWRRDDRTQYSRSLPRDPVSLLFPNPFGLDARDGGTEVNNTADTYSRGIVLVAAPWLRFFYNQSSSIVLQNSSASDLYSRAVGNADGKGTETGVRLALFNGRMQVSLSRWDTEMQGQAIASIRNQLGLFNFVSATSLLWNTAAELSGDEKYLEPPYLPKQAFTDYQDFVAEGYELTVTANPTRNWRMTLNAGMQTNEQSNIGSVLREYWAEYEPVWRQFPGKDLNGNGVIDATAPGTPEEQIEKFGDRPGGTQGATISQLLDGYAAGVERIASLDGVSTVSIPKWTGNFLTNYRFSSGPLANVGVGGSLNYRSPRTIGFLLTDEGLYRPDEAIKGAANWRTGLWVSYSRSLKFAQLSRPLRWRVQLNVRNVFNDRDLEPINGMDDGDGHGEVVRWHIPEPRTFVLSNTIEF